MKRVLVAAHAPQVGRSLRSGIGPEYTLETVTDHSECLARFQRKRYEFLFIEVDILKDPQAATSYQEALNDFYRIFPTADIIVMSSPEFIREAVMAVKAGAGNYLTYPIDVEEVRYVMRTTYESRVAESELDYLRNQCWQGDDLAGLHTESPLMRAVLDKVRSVAPTRSTVLLNGETGTGKSLLATMIHRLSNRKDAPFISVHCGAIPDTLLESELFGHEKGAFTGAVRRRLGKFEVARNGTVFLDEIGTMSHAAQIKLLEVLQEGTFRRLGGEEVIQTQARVIAATNTDLKGLSERGLFRRDLYYRLDVFPVELPPLRERIEDLGLLVEVFLGRMNREYGKGIRRIQPEVMEALRRYPWPGNIRELENVVERAYILESSTTLGRSSFAAELFDAEAPLPAFCVNPTLGLAEVRRLAVEEVERCYLRELLTVNHGRIKSSALTAGVTPRQLHKLMIKHGLHKEQFKTPHALKPGYGN